MNLDLLRLRRWPHATALPYIAALCFPPAGWLLAAGSQQLQNPAWFHQRETSELLSSRQ